jgi:hypothetical protein
MINPKRYMIMSLILSFLALSSFIFVTYAWFTVNLEQTYSYNPAMGTIDVEIDAYFVDINGIWVMDAEEVEIAPGVTKPGVYHVNINNVNSPEYIENLRVDIIVNSDVPTFIRVKVHKQLTLTYTNYEGEITELSVYMNNEVEEEMMLYYDFYNPDGIPPVMEGWYSEPECIAFYFDESFNIRNSRDEIVYEFVSGSVYRDPVTLVQYELLGSGDLVIANTDIHGDYDIVIRKTSFVDTLEEAVLYDQIHFSYLYYTQSLESETISLIDSYDGDFVIYPTGYSLQIGFEVEAVQLQGGPENVWGLPVPVWDEESTWVVE